MFKRTKVNTGALLALGGALLAAGVQVNAQTAPASERIEVTGSRIRSIGAESTSPITSVGKADIDTVQPVAVEELIRGLPSSYPGIGPQVNNGSSGIASIDLRGLGTNRTLILFNGKRFVPSDLNAVVDTNNVPVSLLERVDLQTGGASATYGADAVAGVVNFITKRNFSGVEGTTLYSVSEQGDAKRRKSDLTVGANLADGRGNVALHVGTTRTEPIRLADRAYASTVISSTTGNPGGFSGTAVPAVFSGMPAPIAGSRVIDASTGLLRTAVVSGPPDGYNTNPPNYFETPLTRTQATGLGRFSINDYAEAYAEIFYTRSNVTLNLAPSGSFGVALNIPIGNPFITQPVRNQLCAAYGISTANCVAGNTTEFTANVGRRFVEAGPRVYSYDNTTMQYTTGLRGSIPYIDAWTYDAYYQKGQSDQTQQTANGFSSSKLQNAVRATNTTTCLPTTVGGSPPTGCVPVNLFGGAGTITPAMLAYLSTPTFQTTRVTQEVISASANGEVALAKSPFATAGLSLALGAEQRTVIGANKSDAVIQTQGELLGSGAPTPDRTGELKFKELYMEAVMPLVNNVTGVQSLNLQGGYRRTNFSTSAGADQSYGSWKAGLDYAPIKGLRFRGEQQRATRAPNVNELYQPVTTGLSGLAIDPCQLALISAAQAGQAGTLTNLCQQTGVPTSQIGAVAAPSSSQINNTAGGNPNLKPERADTTTIGFVWEPTFVPNLSVNVDYWKIKIDGAVSSPTANQVVQGCYTAAQNPGFTYNAFCQLIQRDRLNGTLNGTGSLGVVTQSTNLGTVDYSGVDIGASYRLPLSMVGAPTWGRVDLGLQLALLDKADYKSLPTLATVEQAGHYGQNTGNPYPKTRFSQRSTWTFDAFTLGYNWRYIGKSSVEATTTVYQPQFTSIKAFNYVDLNGTWQVLKNLKLSLTVNNLFDKDPPLTGTGIGPGARNFGNTFPGVYDVIGRRYTMSATAAF